MTIPRELAHLGPMSPKNQESLALWWECVRDRFTGTLSFEFKEGTVLIGKQTTTHRFGAAPGGRELTLEG